MQDAIPDEILKKYNLPKLKSALIWIHAPKKQSDSETARKRFAFAEVFLFRFQNKKTAKNTKRKNLST